MTAASHHHLLQLSSSESSLLLLAAYLHNQKISSSANEACVSVYSKCLTTQFATLRVVRGSTTELEADPIPHRHLQLPVSLAINYHKLQADCLFLLHFMRIKHGNGLTSRYQLILPVQSPFQGRARLVRLCTADGPQRQQDQSRVKIEIGEGRLC